MARSAALREALTVAAVAAGAWALLVAVLFRLVPLDAERPVPGVRASAGRRAVPAHRTAAAHAWHGAAQVYDEVDRRAVGLHPEERVRVARTIVEEAAQAGIAPLLVLAVIHVESRFDPRAVSPVGAVGLMQLMVPTFREVADAPRVDPFDPVANVRAGVRYLGRLVGTFSDVELALVAYNAGPGRVRRHLESGGVPDRLRAYPRDVLRQAVRLWPEVPALVPERPEPAARLALGAAHAPVVPAPVRAGALAIRGPARPALAPATAAAPDAGAAYAAGEALAAVQASASALEAAWFGPSCGGACVPLQLGLPMSRGRERTGRPGRAMVLS